MQGWFDCPSYGSESNLELCTLKFDWYGYPCSEPGMEAHALCFNTTKPIYFKPQLCKLALYVN